MTIEKDPQSRFSLSTPIVFNGVETFGLLTQFPFLDPNNLQPTDIVTLKITPDLARKPWAISQMLYNSPVLDWVIVLFNKPLNPVGWPAIGTIIKAPAASVVIPLV
jgi:hypothetical protein